EGLRAGHGDPGDKRTQPEALDRVLPRQVRLGSRDLRKQLPRRRAFWVLRGLAARLRCGAEARGRSPVGEVLRRQRRTNLPGLANAFDFRILRRKVSQGGSLAGPVRASAAGKGQKRARLSPAKVRGAETMDDLAGRMAVVTGGGSGLGRPLAIACARRGRRVLLADVDEDSLGATAALLARPDTLRLRVDVSRPDEVAGLAELAYREAPDVALLFN